MIIGKLNSYKSDNNSFYNHPKLKNYHQRTNYSKSFNKYAQLNNQAHSPIQNAPEK